MTKEIALLEVSTGHVEVLFSQALFLIEAGYTVHLIVPECNKDRVLQFKLDLVFHFIPEGTRWQRFKYIRKVINRNNIPQLVINTAHGSIIKYLPFMLPKTRIIGVLHGLEKIYKSFSQKLLSFKIRNYYVLSEHLYRQCPTVGPLHFSYFYAIFFPPFPKVEILDKQDQFWIVIPGQLEYKRRDYASLITHLNNNLDPKVRFLLLGSHNHNGGDGVRFKEELRKKNLEDRFIFFDTFIDDAVFHNYLQSADCIMPLVFEQSRYFNLAISGTFNLAFAHKKVQLMHQSYQVSDEFRSGVIFYEHFDVTNLINSLSNKPKILLDKERELKQDPRFSLEEQKKHYLKLIEL